MRTLTETSAEVNYNQVLKATEIRWKGFSDTEQYKRILEHTLDMIKETKSTVWISDLVYGKAVPKDAVEWLQKSFIPRAKQAGVRKIAFLVTGNAFGKLHVANLKAATKQLNVDMKSFDTRAELEDWLFS
jgi:hypothetical protein